MLSEGRPFRAMASLFISQCSSNSPNLLHHAWGPCDEIMKCVREQRHLSIIVLELFVNSGSYSGVALSILQARLRGATKTSQVPSQQSQRTSIDATQLDLGKNWRGARNTSLCILSSDLKYRSNQLDYSEFIMNNIIFFNKDYLTIKLYLLVYLHLFNSCFKPSRTEIAQFTRQRVSQAQSFFLLKRTRTSHENFLLSLSL